MSAVPFDTLKFVERLEAGGVSHAQAKATAEAFAEATSQELATKADISELKSDIRLEMADLRGVQRLHSWMLGALLAGMGSLLLKTFFH